MTMTTQQRAAGMNAVPFVGNADGIKFNADALGIKAFTGKKATSPFTGESISITITNAGTSAEDRLICIFPGWHTAASALRDREGNTPAAILADGTFITTTDKAVAASSSDSNINDVVQGIKYNPCRLKGVKFVADNADQLNYKFEIQELSFKGRTRNEIFVPSAYKDSSQNDDKRSELALNDAAAPYILGVETAVYVKVKAGRTLTMTLFIDNIKSDSAQLSYVVKKGV